MKFVEQRYEKGFWLMSSLTALFVIFSLMLFLYNEYERETHKNCPFYLSDDAKFPLGPEYWFR